MLVSRYDMWKQAHALPVENLMALYSPEARIVFTIGPPGTLKELRREAQMVRQNHIFDQVSDVGPVHISINGARATVTARHRYGHSSNPQQPSFGGRTLIWEKQGDVWLVVADRFPSSFSSQP